MDKEITYTEFIFSIADELPIKITLKNEVLTHHGKYHGIYERTELVNGKPCWTLNSEAIWYNQDHNIWIIGNLDQIGTTKGHFFTTGTLFGANEDGKWKSFIEKKTRKIGKNDFSIERIARKGTNQQIINTKMI